MKFLDKIIGKKNKKSEIQKKEINKDIDNINEIEIIKCTNIEEYTIKKQYEVTNKIKKILEKSLIFNEKLNKSILEVEKFSNKVKNFLEKEKEASDEILEFTKKVENIQKLSKIEQKEQNEKMLRKREVLIKKRELLINQEKSLNLKLEDINCVLIEIKDLAQIYLKERI